MRSSRGTRLLTTIGIVALAMPIAVTQPLRFDAASVKPSAVAAVVGNGFRISPGHLRSVNTTVEQLVRFAYGLDPGDNEALTGGPRWIRSDRFEVEGKAEGAALVADLSVMLKSLLADRFKLRLHEEMKERDIYALTFAKSDRKLGPGLRLTPPDEAAHCASREKEPPAASEFTPDGLRRCAASSRGGIKLRGRPLADLADMLGELVGRAVIDRTGLSQRVDADLNAALNWDHLVFGGVSDTLGSNAVIFTALQEQLGLKLESARGAVRTLVIDSVERPTED